MARIIDRAAADPEGALDFSPGERAELETLFGDDETLLLALRQRWMTTLSAKLDQAAYDDTPVERVRAELAAAQPGLYALIDAATRRSVRVRALEQGEQRMVDYFDGPHQPRRRVGAA